MLTETSSSEDQIFRYRIEKEQVSHHHNRLIELVRANLENILDIIIPTYNGVEVKVDGFKLLCDRGTEYEMYSSGQRDMVPPAEKATEGFQDSVNARIYEPRIDFIKRQLKSLLPVVDLEEDGRVVEVDGFRLRNLDDWLVHSNCDPSEVFGHLATHCNCNCVFCYLKGNPASVALKQPSRSFGEEYEEVETRIRHFFPLANRCLFPTLGGIYEPLAHPQCVDVLRMLRQKTSKVIRIATNGENLTPALITSLADLQPIYLYLSLNSYSPLRRRELMQSRHPEIAIDALPMLREKGIPYATVIVPWPIDSIDEMLADLATTTIYANENETHLVQVNLPGYSRYLSEQKLFDLEQLWSAVVAQVRELRQKVACPIVVMPTMYEENVYEQQKNLAKVIGTVINSPAAWCGLKGGDIIRGINGLSVRNRPQARDILLCIQRSREKQVHLRVERNGQFLELTTDLTQTAYPYSRETDNNLGVIFLGTGLRLSYIENLRDIIRLHKAKEVLLLSSMLVRPILEQCILESHVLGDPDIRLHIEVPANRFFGGNILMGDLLVVQDFIDHIKEYVENAENNLDLVVIPSSPFNLSGWGRDLTGRVYLDIEREVHIPVELLECATIYE